ncbi:hypothetical protein ACIRP2_19915, partial [Streptomyces sp. NPDC101194]
RPGLRSKTLADVFAHARAEGVELRLDATEIQLCRPVAGRGGRRAFVSGKKKQNTMMATVIADDRDRPPWIDGLRRIVCSIAPFRAGRTSGRSSRTRHTSDAVPLPGRLLLDLMLRLGLVGRLAMTPQTIADAHHISLRHLPQLLAEDGTSPSAWIRHRRLERCRLGPATLGSQHEFMTTTTCADGSGPGASPRASPAEVIGSSPPLGRPCWTAERTVSWPAGCRRLHHRYEHKA